MPAAAKRGEVMRLLDVLNATRSETREIIKQVRGTLSNKCPYRNQATGA